MSELFRDKVFLDSIDLIEIYGPNNSKINLIKSYFPNLKVLPRGIEVAIQGTNSDIEKFKFYFIKIINFIKENKSIDSSDINYLMQNKFINESSFKSDVLFFSSDKSIVQPKTINQKKMISLLEKNSLLFSIGPAGTGKTYVAVALAAQALKEKKIKKIILTRPAVEAGENLGFLPGDLYDKLSPYMRPLYDALNEMFSKDKLDVFFKKNQIEIVPLAFMRGRTLDNAFVILDEAQNTTINQMKMFLTRMGPLSKFIICGDVSQVDLPKNQTSGLLHASNLLESINGIGCVEFNDQDVIRHELVKNIIKAYKK